MTISIRSVLAGSARFASASFVLAALVIPAGCATKLVVTEDDRAWVLTDVPPKGDAKDASGAKDAESQQYSGVVINQRASYVGTATLTLPKTAVVIGNKIRTQVKEPMYAAVAPGADVHAPLASGKPAVMDLEIGADAGWVDHKSVLVVGIHRDAFASGKLVIKMDDRQVVKELGLTSTIGTKDAVGTVTTLIEDRKKIVEARKKKDDSE